MRLFKCQDYEHVNCLLFMIERNDSKLLANSSWSKWNFDFQISNKHEPVDPALISEYIALSHFNQHCFLMQPFKIQNYHQMFQLLRYFWHISTINTKLQPTADSSDQKYIDGLLRQGDLPHISCLLIVKKLMGSSYRALFWFIWIRKGQEY